MLSKLINIAIDLLIYPLISILKCIFKRKNNTISEEKEHKIKLFDTVNSEAVIQNETVNYAITEITEYYIEHIFCDYQTFIGSISHIVEALPNIESIERHKNKIDVKFIDLEDITIQLDNYRISIFLYDIIKSTPLKEVEMIMHVFKDKINSFINHTEST